MSEIEYEREIAGHKGGATITAPLEANGWTLEDPQ